MEVLKRVHVAGWMCFDVACKLTDRLDDHEEAIVHILDEIKKLMEPLPGPEPKRREIGFQIRDEAQARLTARTREH